MLNTRAIRVSQDPFCLPILEEIASYQAVPDQLASAKRVNPCERDTFAKEDSSGDDPDQVIHDDQAQGLLLPRADIPLSGSRLDPADDCNWVENGSRR